jgi:hypothetical protein
VVDIGLMKTFRRLVPLGAAVAASAVLLAACSGSSDKPAFCGDIETLQNSITQLSDIQLEPGVLDNFQTQLETVQSNAQTAVDSARSDFPQETDALDTAINNLETSVQDLPSSPSATQLGAVALNVSATVNAAQDLQSAAESACN